jgi:AcrR family transcriptional regulator
VVPTGTKVKEREVTTGLDIELAPDSTDERPARARILDAALAAFSEHGYAQASMLEIATRAKVSKRELYALVGNKHDMLVACITERAGRLRLMTDQSKPADRSGLERALTKFGERLVLELSQPAVLGVFRLAIAEAERTPEIGRTLDRLARTAVRTELQSLLERARDGGFVVGEPMEMVQLFMALLWDDLLINLLLRTVEPPDAPEAAKLARRAAAGVLRVHAKT